LAPAISMACISFPKLEKFADNIEGAIITLVIVFSILEKL